MVQLGRWAYETKFSPRLRCPGPREPGNLADMRQNGVRSVEAWADAALKLAKHKRKRESNAPCPRAPPKRER
jgi:hypothetical protein